MTHDQKRYWMHAPLGLLTAYLYLFPPAGLAATIGFLGYEAIQDWRKIDHSYKDVIGWLQWLLVGLAVLVTLLLFDVVETLG